MKKTNKTIGIFIIGMSITLLIAILVLLLYDDLLVYDKATYYEATYFKAKDVYSWQFSSENIFMELLFMGTAFTSIIALNNHKKILKAIVYPISIGLITGTLLGVFFPEASKSLYRESFYFNVKVFIAVLALGFFISLISVGNYYLRK